jgi:hypothetical protein
MDFFKNAKAKIGFIKRKWQDGKFDASSIVCKGVYIARRIHELDDRKYEKIPKTSEKYKKLSEMY